MRFPIHLKHKAIFGVLIAASLVALSLPFASSAADKAAPAKAHASLTVSTTSLAAAEWPVLLTANGNIAAWQEAVVGAEASGLRLTEVLVNVGDQVRKGQVLARLQSETVAAEFEQTQASLAEAEATLAEAHANAERENRQGTRRGAESPLEGRPDPACPDADPCPGRWHNFGTQCHARGRRPDRPGAFPPDSSRPAGVARRTPSGRFSQGQARHECSHHHGRPQQDRW